MPAESSMIERMVGAATLDVDAYGGMEHDETATRQAAGVVVLGWFALAVPMAILAGIVGG